MQDNNWKWTDTKWQITKPGEAGKDTDRRLMGERKDRHERDGEGAKTQTSTKENITAEIGKPQNR